MKNINLEVTCKRDRFGYWNLCKRLPNFVNVAALVGCHAGVLGSNHGPKIFSPWNYFTGGSGNSVAPELASGSGSGLYLVGVDARLSGNKCSDSAIPNSLAVG